MQGIKLAEVLALLSTMTKYEVLCGIVMRQHIAAPDPHNVYPRSTKRGHSRDNERLVLNLNDIGRNRNGTSH